ncbi:MAG: InlB B-repeat-containing protein [Bacteroidales bacterium]|nr:InlB B-repeat-containing protein [Bacteroidales bacterium]
MDSKTAYSYTIANTKSAETFDLTFTNTSTGDNCRLDDIVLKVKTAGTTTNHTLTYSVTNGTITGVDGGSSAVASGASVAEGAKVYLTATPSSASYAFKNWAVSGTGSTLYNVNSDTTAFKMGTADATVTAYFATPHNFEYTATNGTVTVNKGRPVATNTPVAEGGVMNISATPNSGYRFKKWNVTGSGSSVESETTNPTTFTMGTANANLEAVFEAVYTVTYDANGGTGTMTDGNSPYTSGSTVTVLNNTFIRDGYDFSIWNTQNDGNGTDYEYGDEFEITANTTLYAQWAPGKHTVIVASIGSASEIITAVYGNNVIAESGNASVAYGTEITLRADGLAAGKGIVWDVYKTGETGTKVTVTDNKFTVPEYNVTISGTVGNAFVKYTGDIAEGDYVIYATDGAAMKNALQGSNTDKFANQTTNIYVSGNDMVIANATTEADVTWHIANISETSYWTIYNVDEKKYAGSKTAKNTADLLSSVTNNAKWTVEVDNGVYNFINYARSQGTDPNNKFLRRNEGTGWASYATGTGTKPYLYKKTNTYQLDVATVANITNTATPSGQSAIDEDGSAYVKPGVTVTLASTPSADYIIDEWNVYKTDTPATKVTVTSNTFTMPDYAVTVSATTRAIEKVDVKYYVNGALLATVNVTEGDEMTLKTAGDISAYVPSGFTFAGWTDNEEDLSTLYTGTYTPAGATNLYAVFSGTKPATFSFTIDKDDFTTESYAINNGYTKNKTATAATGETMSVTCYSYQIQQSSSLMQWQKSAGYLYNSTDLGTVKSVIVTSTAGSFTTYYGTTAQPSSGDAGTGKGYFKTIVGGETGKTSSVVVVFTKSVARKFTRIIDDDVDINTTVTLNAPAIIESGQTLTIEDGGILDAGNYLTIEDGGTLIIEDGGQIILPEDASVNATVKRHVTGNTKAAAWEAFASTINTPAIGNTNLITGTYDLYMYDESADKEWVNYKAHTSYFANLTNSRGYLYRNAATMDITIEGALNTSDISDYTLSRSGSDPSIIGFNFVGNPYQMDIYKGVAISNTYLETGYYVLDGGAWSVRDDDVAIAPGAGILVQANSTGDGKKLDVTYTNASAKANHDNIMFTVGNSEYSDVTYAMFDEGHGLNKISHRNQDVPMLYIPQNDENFAIAMMNDDTKAFELNFKAMTTGKYTLSCKTKGNYSYLHVIDRLTGEDVDMLLEGEYSFIASKQDNENRFIVRLEYSENPAGFESSTFAWQNGSDIIVNGEGELQIFDVMGRRVSTVRVSGETTITAPSMHGVYIFKLNDKTQKIVVK